MKQQQTTVSKSGKSSMRKLKAESSYQPNIQSLYQTTTCPEIELEKMRERLSVVNNILAEEDLSKSLPLYIKFLEDIINKKHLIDGQTVYSNGHQGQFLASLAFAYLAQGEEEKAKKIFIKAFEEGNPQAAVFIYFHPEMFPSDILTKEQKKEIRDSLQYDMGMLEFLMNGSEKVDSYLLIAMLCEGNGDAGQAAAYLSFAKDVLDYDLKLQQKEAVHGRIAWELAGKSPLDEIAIFIREQLDSNSESIFMMFEPERLAEEMQIRMMEERLSHPKVEDLKYPIDAHHAFYLAEVNSELGNYEEAIKWLNVLIEINNEQENEGLIEKRGLAYLGLGKLEEAAVDLQSSKNDFLKGLVHLVLHQEHHADLKKAVETSYSNRNVAALLLAYLGEEKIHLEPREEEILHYKIANKAIDGNLEEALLDYNDVIVDYYPYWAITWQRASLKERAIVHAMMGNKDLAAQDLARAKRMESFWYVEKSEDRIPVADLIARALDVVIPD